MSKDKALDKSHATQTAILRREGVSITAISRQLKLKRHQVERLTTTPEYKKVLDKLDADSISYASKLVKHRVANMSDLVANTLEKRLRDGSDKSLEMALKMLGLLKQEEKEGSDQIQGLQLVFPGGVSPTTSTVGTGKHEHKDKKVQPDIIVVDTKDDAGSKGSTD